MRREKRHCGTVALFLTYGRGVMPVDKILYGPWKQALYWGLVWCKSKEWDRNQYASYSGNVENPTADHTNCNAMLYAGAGYAEGELREFVKGSE